MKYIFWKMNQLVDIYGGLRRDTRLEATVILRVDRGIGNSCLESKESEDNTKKKSTVLRLCYKKT